MLVMFVLGHTYSFIDKLAYNWKKGFCYLQCCTEIRSVFVIRTDHKPLKYMMESPSIEQKDSTLDHKHLWLQL